MLDTINKIFASFSTADLLLAAGFIATGLQYLINRFANVKKFTNQLLGLLLPFMVVAPAWIDSQHQNVVYGSIVYAVAQTIYYVIERIKAGAVAKVAPELPAGV